MKYEWSETKVENRIEIETGKQQVAATQQLHSRTRKQKSNSRQTQNSGESLVLIKSLYFPKKSFKINLFKIFQQVVINCDLLLKSVIISLFDYWPKI